MAKSKIILAFLLILVCSLFLSGCDKRAKDREDSVIREELEEVKFALGKTQNERDQLKEDILELSEQWEKAKADMAIIAEAYEQVQGQVEELVSERDKAIDVVKDAPVTIEKLKQQLKENTEQILEYEEWVKELQATIEELEEQIRDMGKQSEEDTNKKPGEDSNEQSEGRITNGNSV